MLNCCIHQKQKRELTQVKQESKFKYDKGEDEDEDDNDGDDDEFYDCVDEDTITGWFRHNLFNLIIFSNLLSFDFKQKNHLMNLKVDFIS